MAFIRIARPGYPVNPDDFLDLGPARGRIAGSGGIFGGPIIAPRKPPTGMFLRPTPKAPYQSRPSLVPRCTRPLRKGPYAGTPCARRLGHNDGCASAAAVERDNMSRRRKGVR